MTWNNDNSLTENGEFRIGQEFNSLDHLKKNVKAWAIANSRNFCVIESEPLVHLRLCDIKIINKIAQSITVMTIHSLFLI